MWEISNVTCMQIRTFRYISSVSNIWRSHGHQKNKANFSLYDYFSLYVYLFWRIFPPVCLFRPVRLFVSARFMLEKILIQVKWSVERPLNTFELFVGDFEHYMYANSNVSLTFRYVSNIWRSHGHKKNKANFSLYDYFSMYVYLF